MEEEVVRVLEEEYLLRLLDISGNGGELEEMYVGHIWTIIPHLPCDQVYSCNHFLLLHQSFYNLHYLSLVSFFELTMHTCG